MGYTVTCPQCQEVNSGSQLYCTKCQASLVGVPREQASATEEVAQSASIGYHSDWSGRLFWSRFQVYSAIFKTLSNKDVVAD